SRTTMPIPALSRRLVHAWVFGHASLVIANADSVREFTVSYYGAPRDRLRVVRNGVDLEPYRTAVGTREAARRELGIEQGAVVGGMVGRLSREKNLELFADMAAGLCREFPDLRFVLVGDGPARRAAEVALDRDGA